MYYLGEGGWQDIHLARELYERAAEQGFAPAKEILDKVFKKTEKQRAPVLNK